MKDSWNLQTQGVSRERRTDLERLPDDLLRLILLPELSSIDRIRSEHDRQLECTEDGTTQLGHKERRNIDISDRRVFIPNPAILHRLGP
jgi:hypothetical protein